MSALHYRDNWVNPLDIDQIEIPFHAASGEQPIMMMIGSGSNGNFLENDDAIAVSWPMESGATAIFTMPKEAIDITGFVKSGMAWETITRCRKGEESFKPTGGIKLILPEIDLKSEDFDLAGKLRAMGLHKIFQPNAELHGITEADASVTQIIQESMLKLDANGAEGAAYTAIVSVTGCNVFDPISEPVTVIFDRPFAFAVFSHSDVPLFIGTYLSE